MDKKVAVITGSTRGIGKAIAGHLGALGYAVAISGRKQEGVDSVVQEMQDRGFEAFGVAADVAIVDDATKLINAAIDRYKRVDVLINNAGITRDNLLMRMAEEDWDAVIGINLKGAFNCIKAATRTLMKQRDGVIINITSVVGQIGNPGQVNYSASKAGMIGMTKAVAKELASRNIRVNAVAPGFIRTDMTAALTEEQKQTLMTQIPLNRLGEDSDVADLVAFLASDKATYITGQVFNVDGGMVMI
jgi:3-oxoacyl-[acyl-carrier protein] reductase